MPPIVSTAYTYDTASNRTGAFDARPKSSQPLSNMCAYDGLHRLVDARRGVWTGGLASPSVSQRKGSQDWALDPLGNWSSVGTDLDGAGGIDSDETELRDHRDPSLTPPTNRVNELFQRELAPDTGGGTVNLAYDYAGNLLRQQLQSGGALRYTHDAWNRLVKVEFEDAEEDLHPRAEYDYNTLNWRTVERTDTDTTDSTHGLDEMRVHLYDPSWRLLESRIDSDFDPEETSPDFEEHIQLVWGIRYIDDIVATRRDLNPAEEDGAEVRMFHATDAQFSSVAVLLNNGSLLERVAYSPYGVARHQWPADASGDGAVNSADLSIVLSSYGSITSTTYRSEADFNRDGNVDAADLAAVLSYAAALPEGTLSSPGIANRAGYCGYRFAPETEMYLARNRWHSPPLGRWIERDPLGYVDGMGLYEYVRGSAVSAVDPWGLEPPDNRSVDQRRADMCRAIRDARKHGMSLDEFLKKYATTFGDDGYAFYQTHGTFEGKDIDIDWLLTLLYSNRHQRVDFEAVGLPGGISASPWLLYHVGKAAWIVLDSWNDPNRHLEDFAKRYRQQEELDTIDLADRILANEVNIYDVLAKMAGCPICPGEQEVGHPAPPMTSPSKAPTPGWASPPPVAPRRGRLGVDGVFTIPPNS